MNNAKTLKEAKKYLRDNFEKGVDCPCCGQFVKKYNRKITSSMAYGLLLLSKLSPEKKWIHVDEIVKISAISHKAIADFPKFKYWGLIIASDEQREDGSKRNGMWMITDKGRDFVNGVVKIPSRVLIYNSKFIGFDGDDVTIQEILGEKFNYRELMDASYK